MMAPLSWMANLLGLLPFRPKRNDQESFTRRERDLRWRLERLSQEVDVIQRVETREESHE